MKKLISFFAICLILCFPKEIFANNFPDEISIKIGQDQREILLQSKEGFVIERFSQGIQENSSEVLKIYLDGFGKANILTSETNNFSLMDGDLIRPRGGITKYKDTSYRGNFYVLVSKGKLILVNKLPVEDYLKGVIPKEIGSEANMEALKAQAVVSRTFSYANFNKFRDKGYNLDNTTSSQVYGGYSAETKATNQAVEETRGQVVYYGNQLANTIFHATSGGFTESLDKVWGGESVDYLRAQADPYSINTPSSKWKASLSKEDLNAVFSNELGDVQSLEILERSSSNRISKIKINGTRGTKVVSGNNFRLSLGPTKIKSTNFSLGDSTETSTNVITSMGIKVSSNSTKVVTNKEQKSLDQYRVAITSSGRKNISRSNQANVINIDGPVTINGSGYGHGVGMSQYGAINMAKEGKSYKEILDFYFPGTILGSR